MESHTSGESLIQVGSDQVHVNDSTKSITTVGTRMSEDENIFVTVSNPHLISSVIDN